MVSLPDKHTVTIEVAYDGALHCAATHMPSGATLDTDAPKDNHGKGMSFSPTDLVATALGSCILTVMGITARALHTDIRGAKAVVIKEMVAAPIRRIGRLDATVTMPAGISEEHKAKLEQAAHSCPVHQSLHPEIHAPITFIWK